MKKYIIGCLAAVSLTLGVTAISAGTLTDLKPLNQSLVVHQANQIPLLFPKTMADIDQSLQSIIENSTSRISQIISIPSAHRTFENTVQEFDRTVAYALIKGECIYLITQVHPDSAMREKAQKALIALTDFSVDLFETNQDVYRAVKEYVEGNGKKENLSTEREYYLTELMTGFRRAGLELDQGSLDQMKSLQKQIVNLTMQFNANIAQDQSTLSLKEEDLTGIDTDFLSMLKREGENYIIGCDYPTRDQVMNNCMVETTRRDYSRLFSNRAYPKNVAVLNQLVNARDDLARLLGYRHFAEYDLESQMAKTCERVEEFIQELALEANPKATAEWETLFKDLPESVALTANGKINPWDTAYLEQYYMKKHLNVDESKIAEYFPMETTIKGLLNIYQQFFGLKFKVVKSDPFWDPEVQLIEVRHNNAKQSLIGYVILDLFPRDNKFSHACCGSIISPMTFDGGKSYEPAAAIVIANFSKSTQSKPSLLKHDEVQTFFHEFGHAIHAMLGKAEMTTLSGYHAKMDFVEAPSQLLEEWIWDRDILKVITRHYQTGEVMPDEMIDALIATKTFGENSAIMRQLSLAELSLNLFKEGQDKDPAKISKEIYNKIPRHIEQDPEAHMFCSFGHLTGYGAKYYGYQWSKKLALQIFDYIKVHGGLLDPIMGQRYISKVIGKGGSCDPNLLMIDFLDEAR